MVKVYTIQEQKENVRRETETLKKHMRVLKSKSLTKMKNAVHGQSCLMRGVEPVSLNTHTYFFFLSLTPFSSLFQNENTKRKKDRIFRKGGTITK